MNQPPPQYPPAPGSDLAPGAAPAPAPYPPGPAPYGAPMPHAGAPAPALDPRARTAGILMLVCALALLIGIGSKSWFTGRGGTSLGVLGIEECRGMVCHSITWFDAKRVPGEIQVFSALAL